MKNKTNKTSMKDFFKNENFLVLKKSFLAGIFISIACIVSLQYNNSISPYLFNIGLLGVVIFQANLFTGKSGFFKTSTEFKQLFLILFGNILFCFLCAYLIKISNYNFLDISKSYIDYRISLSYISCFFRAVFCGILMTLAIQGTKQNNFIPLLFCVPVFIISKFFHSIADAFYFSTVLLYSPIYFKLFIIRYLVIILGNFIGCNIPRILSN